jgi:DNA-binding response OmpR family regulator
MQRGTYYVDTAASAQEALTSLICDKYDLMLCECPIERMDELAERSKLIGPDMPIVCISRGKAPVTYEGIAIDARLWKPPMAELLERVRIMTASKRGPRKGFQAQRPVRTEWFTLPGKKTA